MIYTAAVLNSLVIPDGIDMRIQLIHTSGPLKGKIQSFYSHNIRIGRDKACDITFPYDYTVVATLHVIISRSGSQIKLINIENSWTEINNKKITDTQCPLYDGDVITIGEYGPKIAILLYEKEMLENANRPVNDIDQSIIMPSPAARQIPASPIPMPKDTPGFLNNSIDWALLMREELDKLSLGQILFNPPNEMKVGQSDRIEVRISQNLKIDIHNNLKGKGLPEIFINKVSPFMKVRLSGNDFDIITLHEEGQIVSKDDYTEWAWDVMPLKAGIKALHLLISVRIQMSLREEKKDFPIIDKDVKVNVNPIYTTKRFIKNNWKWIATALILPILGWAIKSIF